MKPIILKSFQLMSLIVLKKNLTFSQKYSEPKKLWHSEKL